MSVALRGMLCVVLVALAGTAGADGVIEINQARAMVGGVTPGDLPGFPVTLNDPGSYQLTGDLALPDANTSGIVIAADYVNIDLNGFQIHGVTVCQLSGSPAVVTCSPTGAGSGVLTNFPLGNYSTVRNGTVRGNGFNGVSLRDGSRVESLIAANNGNDGIAVGISGAVTDSTVSFNGDDGISVQASGRVERSVANSNRHMGIRAGTATAVVDNTANGNGSYGVDGSNLSVIGNTLAGNGSNGVTIDSGGLVTANFIYGNGLNAIQCINPGVAPGCNVVDNTISSNGGSALASSGDSAYKGNVMNANASTVSGATQTGTNVCNSTTTCP